VPDAGSRGSQLIILIVFTVVVVAWSGRGLAEFARQGPARAVQSGGDARPAGLAAEGRR
jgi:hypothetical protein